MENFTPFLSLIGGMLIGLSALLMLLLLGRITGISGIFSSALSVSTDIFWRIGFLIAIPMGAYVTILLLPNLHTVNRLASTTFEFNWFILIPAAFLVGLGTQLGGGCTSGHGICGISRLSTRSIIAVITFMMTAFVTVFITKSLLY